MSSMKIQPQTMLNSMSAVNPNQPNETNTLNKSVEKAASFEKALEKAKANNDDAALKKSCQEFESIFVNMMFKQMRQTSEIQGEGIIEKSHARGVFESMLDEEMSKKVAGAGGIGLGKVMYNQLKKYTE